MNAQSFFAALLIGCCALSSMAASQQNTRKTALAKTASTPGSAAGPAYARREDVMLAAADIAERRDLEVAWVRKVLGQAHYLPSVTKLIQPPPTGVPKNWQLYRSRFIEPVRIKAGVKFWQDNRRALARAESETGVPTEIIVGIVGVETIYGRQMGKIRVLDALATLAFDFPLKHPRAAQRSAFFKDELEQFLSLAWRTGLDPLTALGSYAGAMGMPQFMPSSWARYAVDFDGDGKIDLQRSDADTIGSVANYLKVFNWQVGLPTHYGVRFDADKLELEALLTNDVLPTLSVTQLIAKGALLDAQALTQPGLMALIELQNGDAPPSYFVGTENFYVITRYNWSAYYAMAVIELGQEVARAMKPID